MNKMSKINCEGESESGVLKRSRSATASLTGAVGSALFDVDRRREVSREIVVILLGQSVLRNRTESLKQKKFVLKFNDRFLGLLRL